MAKKSAAAGIDVKVTTYTPEQIKKVSETFDRLLNIGKTLALITPTKLDDESIAVVQTIHDALKPIMFEPWFPEVLDLILSLVKKKDVPAIVALLKELDA